jgi:hypothetical protein
MPKTLIIIEDDSDKHVFEAIIRHIKLQNSLSVIDTPTNTDWKAVADESNVDQPTALIRALKNLLNDISKEKYDKVGIIRDLDDKAKQEKLSLINNALQEAYPNQSQKLSDTNELVPFTFEQNPTGTLLTVHFACHFVSYDGRGEIEDLLKAIKTKPSPIADCVDKHLPECLQMTEEELREKDLVKLWFNHYQRFDTLPENQRKSPYTTMGHIMTQRTDLFDFDRNIEELNELKQFLQKMS